MIDYKIVLFCRFCKQRFVVNRGEAKRMYCTACEKRLGGAK